VVWWVLTGSNRRHSPCKGGPVGQLRILTSGSNLQLSESVGDDVFENLCGRTAVAIVQHRRALESTTESRRNPAELCDHRWSKGQRVKDARAPAVDRTRPSNAIKRHGIPSTATSSSPPAARTPRTLQAGHSAPPAAGGHRAKRLAEAGRESTLQADSNRPVV
jgi:hypothetical protein